MNKIYVKNRLSYIKIYLKCLVELFSEIGILYRNNLVKLIEQVYQL